MMKDQQQRMKTIDRSLRLWVDASDMYSFDDYVPSDCYCFAHDLSSVLEHDYQLLVYHRFALNCLKEKKNEKHIITVDFR